ncbi:hypothetical protein KJ972_01885 [Candidatus Micrarchaeota archaeon]|nr:hypothetical protein [Candidatus Micrarchaeota archaeon]
MTYGWALVVIVVVVAALVLLVGNPAEAGDTCSGPGAGLNITNQELGTSGWDLVISNISGRSITAVTPTGVSSPTPTVEGTYTPFTMTPGEEVTLTTAAGTFVADTHYRTEFSVDYHDGDFTRTVTFSCNGTA